MKTLKSFFVFLKPYKYQYLFGVIGLGLMNFVLNAYMAFILGDLTSSMVEMNQELLVRTILNFIIMISAGTILLYFSVKALLSSTVHVEEDIRSTFFSRILNTPLITHQKYPSGELISRFSNDLNEGMNLFRDSFQDLSAMFFLGLGSCVTIFILDWMMALIILTISTVILLLNIPLIKKLRKSSQRVQQQKASFLDIFTQLVQGQRIIRYFNLAQWIQDKIWNRSEELRKSSIHRNTLEATRESLDQISFWSALIVIIIGGFRAIEDPAYLTTLVVIIQLQNGVSFLFTALTRVFSAITRRLAGVERLMEIMDISEEPAEIAQKEGSSPSQLELKEGVGVENLVFSYPESSQPLLQGISFHIPEGETAAFVGPSGSGKTTLFKLLLGLYEPCEGNIYCSQKSLYTSSLIQWRQLFTYVPQDAFLFSGTIRNNLEAVCERFDDGQMKEAAQMAYASDFIEALDKGYDFTLDESGANLSGGQRQRIALMRSFLSDSAVLLLDEATSALDSESEKIVQAALNSLMKKKTTLVIAHRLSTVKNADCIYFLQEGKIVEKGTHNSLMQIPSGKYRQLVMAGELEQEEIPAKSP